MKQLLILMFAILSLGVQAQDKSEKMAKKQAAKWVEVCEITAEQEAKLVVVLTAKAKDLAEAKSLKETDPAAAKEAKKTINKKYSPQVKEIVGADNVAKMKEYQKQQKAAKNQ